MNHLSEEDMIKNIEQLIAFLPTVHVGTVSLEIMLEEYKKFKKELQEEKQKNKNQEEVIDMMAEEIWRCNAIDCDFKHFKDNICKDEQDTGNKQICKECIKQYYFKKAGDRS